mmetsp:Transcript_80691/g.147676  ORF Transcript_80691/g.147676 Transcript_80691/m.147676 type:complete len:225 (-) Transcript_80691:300-974(-)
MDICRTTLAAVAVGAGSSSGLPCATAKLPLPPLTPGVLPDPTRPRAELCSSLVAALAPPASMPPREAPPKEGPPSRTGAAVGGFNDVATGVIGIPCQAARIRGSGLCGHMPAAAAVETPAAALALPGPPPTTAGPVATEALALGPACAFPKLPPGAVPAETAIAPCELDGAMPGLSPPTPPTTSCLDKDMPLAARFGWAMPGSTEEARIGGASLGGKAVGPRAL